MQYVKALNYAFYVISHPFDGFWDLKREKRGRLSVALTLVALTVIMFAVKEQNTGFLFNNNRLEDINVIVDVITVTMLYILWCVSSWCLTSLMDGEGKFKEIAIATGYSLVPLVIINLPLVLVSHLIILEEGSFYFIFSNFSIIWTAALIFVSTMITHQYSVKKTLLTILLTIVGMGIILFIGLLFFSVIQQMIGFVTILYKEIRFR